MFYLSQCLSFSSSFLTFSSSLYILSPFLLFLHFLCPASSPALPSSPLCRPPLIHSPSYPHRLSSASPSSIPLNLETPPPYHSLPSLPNTKAAPSIPRPPRPRAPPRYLHYFHAFASSSFSDEPLSFNMERTSKICV